MKQSRRKEIKERCLQTRHPHKGRATIVRKDGLAKQIQMAAWPIRIAVCSVVEARSSRVVGGRGEAVSRLEAVCDPFPSGPRRKWLQQRPLTLAMHLLRNMDLGGCDVVPDHSKGVCRPGRGPPWL